MPLVIGIFELGRCALKTWPRETSGGRRERGWLNLGAIGFNEDRKAARSSKGEVER